MTRAEALAEARRIWGPDGFASMSVDGGGRPVRIVGVMVPARSFPDNRPCRAHLTKGEGNSWEAAFEDADRRAQVKP